MLELEQEGAWRPERLIILGAGRCEGGGCLPSLSLPVLCNYTIFLLLEEGDWALKNGACNANVGMPRRRKKNNATFNLTEPASTPPRPTYR